jgi:hypothetical protein
MFEFSFSKLVTVCRSHLFSWGLLRIIREIFTGAEELVVAGGGFVAALLARDVAGAAVVAVAACPPPQAVSRPMPVNVTLACNSWRRVKLPWILGP